MMRTFSPAIEQLRPLASWAWWSERLRRAWSRPELRWLGAIVVLAALVIIVMVVVVFVGQWFFYGPQALDRRVLWMCVAALSIVTAVIRPLDAWLRGWTDRFLFQKKYQWQKTLKEASHGMTRVTSVDHLLKLMGHHAAQEFADRLDRRLERPPQIPAVSEEDTE
jgi:hypothetical protein